MAMPNKQTARHALKEAFETEKTLGLRPLTDERKADILSSHGLREDLGDFSEPGPTYDLDEDTRDRLIAHARQDASQAVSLATFVVQRQRQHTTVLWIIAAALAYIVWRVS